MRSVHLPERKSVSAAEKKKKNKRETKVIRDGPHVMTVELTFQHNGSYTAFGQWLIFSSAITFMQITLSK